MTTSVLVIGTALVKLGALGALSTAIVTGVRWFQSYEYQFKEKESKRKTNTQNVESTGDRMRESVAQRRL